MAYFYCGPVRIWLSLVGQFLGRREVAASSAEPEFQIGSLFHVVTFDVDRAWKGDVTKRTIIYKAALPYGSGTTEIFPKVQQLEALAPDYCISRTLALTMRRRARPSRPVPTRIIEAGSGTSVTSVGIAPMCRSNDASEDARDVKNPSEPVMASLSDCTVIR